MRVASRFVPAAASGWKALPRPGAPVIAASVLALALAAQATVIGLRLAIALRSREAISAQAHMHLAKSPRLSVAAITRGHLFDAAAAAPDRGPPAGVVSLVLSGILAHDDTSSGLAILGECLERTHLYAVGDHLPGGALLRAVFPDRVVIERSGRVDTLTLPKGATLGRSSVLAAAADARPQSAEAEPASILGPLGRVLNPRPFYFRGAGGIQLIPSQNREAFARLGLRLGDRIIAINGQPVESTGSTEVIAQLNAGAAHLTILRRGEPHEVTLDLSQLQAAN